MEMVDLCPSGAVGARLVHARSCVHELQLFNTTRAQSREHELVHAHYGRPFQVLLELEPSRGNRNL